ncbi:hypothetical protein TD95_001338 [Thielaviopsis punctulata]|uniref:cAMP-dependent protein kinase n=1 Tax=Thielaviopsis punctulata TaxID=72032 RepID=A0A0F4ZK35_9PEZI|nr:hypothetical protein TD95_001338 [Thielaviopsis punctulata]
MLWQFKPAAAAAKPADHVPASAPSQFQSSIKNFALYMLSQPSSSSSSSSSSTSSSSSSLFSSASSTVSDSSNCSTADDVAPESPPKPHTISSKAGGYTIEEKCKLRIPLNTEDFKLVRTLGTGTFARVCLVRPAVETDTNRNNVYALKILRKTEVIRLKQLEHVRQERAILSSVTGHPFITTLLGSFADADRLFMLLDYVPGGELFTYLRRWKYFDEPTAQFYAAEIVLVLEHLHEQQDGIAYRDLKPENILLDADGHIRLVDFGFAKKLGGCASCPQTGANQPYRQYACETYTLCGTPEYLAPEVIQNHGHTGAVDWWALGILIYEFLTGFPPFWSQNPIEIYQKILKDPITFSPSKPVSSAAKDIILGLCTVDRSKRLGNIQGGAQRVKQHAFFAGIDWTRLYNKQIKAPIQPPVNYPGDAQCFDVYPEDDGIHDVYTAEMADQYDEYFADF